MKNTIYYNFPVTLLRNFGTDPFKMDYRTTMDKWLDFNIGKQLAAGKSFTEIASILKVIVHSTNQTPADQNRYIKFYQTWIDKSKPGIGIESSLFWKYAKSNDMDFKTLWAFLAIKSILGNKPYQKLNNRLIIARMAGFTSYDELLSYHLNQKKSIPLYIWNPDDKEKVRYRMDKIKKELTKHYHLTFYGIGTRGFYVSSKLTLEKLIYEVESNRSKHIVELERKKNKETRQKVLALLEQEKLLSETQNMVNINNTSLHHDRNTVTTPTTPPYTPPYTPPTTPP